MSTNYYNTLITLAPDSPTLTSVVPDLSKRSVAAQQYVWISDQPYQLTSDEIIFRRVAEKDEIPPEERTTAQEEYFLTGRACLRTSPLPKQYGWGLHFDAEGKLSLVAAESAAYAALLVDERVTKIAAMRRSRK